MNGLGKREVQRLIRRAENHKRMKQRRSDGVGFMLSTLLASGMTQEEIAEELGINQSSVSKYLRNLCTPREETVAALVLLCKEVGDITPARG